VRKKKKNRPDPQEEGTPPKVGGRKASFFVGGILNLRNLRESRRWATFVRRGTLLNRKNEDNFSYPKKKGRVLHI